MVKPGTVVAVAIVAVVGFILYQLLGQGSQGGAGGDIAPTQEAAQRFGFSGGTTASGQGLAISQIYAPQTSYEYAYTPTFKTAYYYQGGDVNVSLLDLLRGGTRTISGGGQ